MPDRVVSPPLDELRLLPTPLTEGEKSVLEFFLKHLPVEWEIYIQPHLNGLRPDFVLLNPKKGIAVYEVKDWNLDAMEYLYLGKPPKLCERRDGKTFSLASEDPVAKVMDYKSEIHGLYCPSLAPKFGVGAITAGVIFTKAETSRLKDLFGAVYKKHLTYPQNPLIGKDEIEKGEVEKVLPKFKDDNPFVSDDVVQELRSWLVEPDFAREQRQPLSLDSRQSTLVTTRTETGFRRIKGPAGSGKSLVLAARAAELASEGKDVLVVSFNITLLNYLRDLAVRRWRERRLDNQARYLKDHITWLNFHHWCKRVAIAAGESEKYAALWRGIEDDDERNAVLDERLANLVSDFYKKQLKDLPRYDAILVDEGQDYRLSWWNALRLACKPNGEMLLVADPTQDLYATARAWTEQAMVGAGFPGGRWVTLDTSYRLPPELIPLACDFAERFLPNDDLRALPEPAQMEMPLARTNLRWVQVNQEQSEEACIGQVLALPRVISGVDLPWADVTFLATSNEFGRNVVEGLSRRGLQVIHTFYKDQKEARRRKLAFFKGAERIKATTLHSFKGWEGRALVVQIPNLANPQIKAAAYAALTRLKRHDQACALTVVCSWDEAESYGRTWPEFLKFQKQGEH